MPRKIPLPRIRLRLHPPQLNACSCVCGGKLSGGDGGGGSGGTQIFWSDGTSSAKKKIFWNFCFCDDWHCDDEI